MSGLLMAIMDGINVGDEGDIFGFEQVWKKHASVPFQVVGGKISHQLPNCCSNLLRRANDLTNNCKFGNFDLL